MSGVRGVGGANRIDPELHRLRGTYQPSRHAQPSPVRRVAVSASDRQSVLAGLPEDAEKFARETLERSSGWDPPSLRALRAAAWSWHRLETLQTTNGSATAIAKEAKVFTTLLRALQLERPR
jgi:hypothetical protein